MSKSLIKRLFRELAKLKLQVFSIAIVVGIGVAVLFGFTTTYRSLEKSRDHFYKTSKVSDVFLRVKKAPNYAAEKLAEWPEIVGLETRLEFEALLALPHLEEPAVGHFISIPDGRQPKMNKIHLWLGRLPDASSADEVVVSKGFFSAHDFILSDHFFATLNGFRKKFVIVGVGTTPEHIFSLQSGSPLPDDKHYSIVWVNESTLSASYDMRSSFNSATFETKLATQNERLIKQIDLQFDRYGGLGAYGRDKQPSHVYVREELKQLQVQALSVPVIFFLVAAFILNVVMSRMVRTQRSEIATLKAVGFFDFEISAYYFRVAAVVVIFGTLIGLGLGAWIGHSMIRLYGDFYHFPDLKYEFTFGHLLLGFVVSVTTAFIGAWASLQKIYRLAPAEAMRPPAPHEFHRSRVEKKGWFLNLGPRSRMMVRGLTSVPLKSLMTGLGFCFSVVILIVGLFWQDCMEFLILSQYSFAQKETGRIQLTHSLSPSAVLEVARLEGVIEAEGYRHAPVRIRFQNREETTTIKALPTAPRLLSALNEKLEDQNLPISGIFLSRNLARQIEVSEADVVVLEFLDEKKLKMSVKVEKIVDSMMSNEILTSRNYLAQLLKTDDRVDQILFRSFSYPSKLYARLKEMPHVLSVTYKDSALRFFEDNAAKFILVFALILSLFAGAIGFGVAFNSMRVALAERDWELATLRILGFTLSEVFRILVGEVILLMLVFLPIGWALGYWSAKWLLSKMSMDSFQIPFVVNSTTFFWATLILLLSTAISALLIFRLIAQSNIVATLKSRG